MIGILILAAGASTRLGKPKQLLLYRGKILLQRAVETALNSSCQPIVVVLGAEAEQLQHELASYPIEVALNSEWEQGMGRSLRVGIETLLAGGHGLDGVVVMLCDQPLVSPGLMDDLAAAFHRTGSPIVACEYGSTVGVPALFSRALFPELLALDGAQGARAVVARDINRVHRIPFPGGEIDIDTVEDYERLNKDNSADLGYSLEYTLKQTGPVQGGMRMDRPHFGLTGLAVMGQNLARNVAHKGFPIVVHNRTTQKTDDFVKEHGGEGAITGSTDIASFVNALERPRAILMMVKAGKPVDAVIAELKPYLHPGDILIDGGNSLFTDTQRRLEELRSDGLLYLGTGISGGEEGALNGPSIMPGGSQEAYSHVEPILTRIAAQVDGSPCCTYIGEGGAGHYVKMVHNGIEYADMQLIAEAYDLLKNAVGLSNEELGATFEEWNQGDLDSFLIQITAQIFRTRDPETGGFLVDAVLDKAAQKGTGKWTSQSALDLGIPVTTITEAVFARCLSALKDQRVAASKILNGPSGQSTGERSSLVSAIRDALYASKVVAYAQGFEQMLAAAEEHGWKLHPGEIATIWRGGCIIRARFLNRIKDAYDQNPDLQNLLLAPYFRDAVEKGQEGWRRVVREAVALGIPIPAFSSALAYYDGYRRERLPANLIQAQRDLFGAHTYERVDKPGSFHSHWG